MNNTTHSLVPAYLIHTKNYRDTSLLIDFFTKNDGFITALAKGIRTPSKSNKRGLLQPFTQLLINYRGKAELVYLNNIELSEQPYIFNNNQLKLSFYINELLYYLCRNPIGIVYPNLFEIYQATLNNLKTVDIKNNLELFEPFLREFELDLLSCLGYGLSFTDINPDSTYSYDFTDGFQAVNEHVSSVNKLLLRGDLIVNIMQRDWSDKQTLIAAKKLLRSIIKYYIGNKELHSRKLFV